MNTGARGKRVPHEVACAVGLRERRRAAPLRTRLADERGVSVVVFAPLPRACSLWARVSPSSTSPRFVSCHSLAIFSLSLFLPLSVGRVSRFDLGAYTSVACPSRAHLMERHRQSCMAECEKGREKKG